MQKIKTEDFINDHGQMYRVITYRLSKKCLECPTIFKPVRRQIFCSPKCSQKARDRRKYLKRDRSNKASIFNSV